jgi:hypothetical protein
MLVAGMKYVLAGGALRRPRNGRSQSREKEGSKRGQKRQNQRSNNYNPQHNSSDFNGRMNRTNLQDYHPLRLVRNGARDGHGLIA